MPIKITSPSLTRKPTTTAQNSASEALSALSALKDPAKAKELCRYFKTGKGEYAEGDVFWGITTPATRKAASKFKAMPLSEIEILMANKVHEVRIFSLLLLLEHAKKDPGGAYAAYLRNIKHINNWDFVDISAGKIVGAHLGKDGVPYLRHLAKSPSVWQRRIAVIATSHHIGKGDPEPAFEICEMLLGDRHDLIHKAAGWMLREAGKKCSQKKEEEFLLRHAARMPRTMLRYAIEKFPEAKRKRYLSIGQ